MIRRDFLKAFGAFAAAVASGVRMPSGQEAALLPAAPLEQPPAADAPLVKAMSMQEQLMEWLVDCDVIGYEVINVIEGFTRYRVTYQMDKARGRRDVHFNDQVKAMVAGKRPISAAVHTFASEVDVCEIGGFGEKHFFPVSDPVVEIEVTWA